MLPVGSLTNYSLGVHTQPVQTCLAEWEQISFGRRLWKKDPTLWAKAGTPEISDRLGWLTLPETAQSQLDEWKGLAEAARAEDVQQVVLIGMGGSSLAPEVLAKTFPPAPGFPRLLVLDTTHPDAVAQVRAQINPARSWFLVSSKSGTTLETISLFRFFWSTLSSEGAARGRRFIAITDPQTPLERLARDRSFRTFVTATPDVGGRYSALTAFGLLPASLIGVDVDRLLKRASEMATLCGPHVPPSENPGLELGAALGVLGRAGIDKITMLSSRSVTAYPVWAEQLIAESTGKEDRGLVPVAGERIHTPSFYGRDRFFASLHVASDEALPGVDAIAHAGFPVARFELRDPYDLGAEFFRWEVGVASAGAVLGIHPFNQPDVELAKELARRAMSAASRVDPSGVPKTVRTTDRSAIQGLLESAGPGCYLAVQAYVAPDDASDAALAFLREALTDRSGLPVTVGYGPRFLHSTGQLHKGGPATGRFLQLIDTPIQDLPVPETDFTFGQIIRAQAAGDAEALVSRERTILRLDLGSDASLGIRSIVKTME